jgi:hypothetical protein
MGAAVLTLVAVADASAGAAAAVPELNPTSLAAGLGAVTGGVLVVRAWFKK